MDDIYASLIGGTPTGQDRQAALAAALRRQALLGQIGAASGDRVAAPLGNNLNNQALTGARELGQNRMEQTAADIKAQQFQQEQAEKAREANMTDRRQRDLNAAIVGERTAKDQLQYGTGDPAEAQAMAQGITEGRIPYPTLTNRSPPVVRSAVALVLANHPEFDSSSIIAHRAAARSEAGGQFGSTMNKLNTAISHVQLLKELINRSEIDQNGNLKIPNTLKQLYEDQTGNPAPAQFNQAKQLLTNEISNVYNVTGGTMTERDSMKQNLSLANSPQVLNAVLDGPGGATQFMAGKVGAMHQQYMSDPVRAKLGDDFYQKYLEPSTRAVLGKYIPGMNGQQPAGGAQGGGVQSYLDKIRQPQPQPQVQPNTGNGPVLFPQAQRNPNQPIPNPGQTLLNGALSGL